MANDGFFEIDTSLDGVPLPPSLTERVAIDKLKRVVYVERSSASSPLFLSWIARNASHDFVYTIHEVSFDEVARMRSGGLRETEDVDVDLKVRAEAIQLLCEAAAHRASDMHLMMRGSHSEIQIVVKGGLRVIAQKTHEAGEQLARAIYQGLATVRDASYKQLEYQNAQISGDVFPPETMLSSLRIVRGPSYPQASAGSFMTLRLQYTGSQKQRSTKLRTLSLPAQPEGQMQLTGYLRPSIEKLRLLMDAPTGIVLFLGPTGSGKTTSLYEVLKELARKNPHRRLVTIEDPVEYPMEWGVQLAITDARNDEETARAFTEGLRVALRMAPKYILLGELRDAEVALGAFRAAVTGHLVFTTLHATDPFLFVERLELMDSERLNRRVFCDHKMVRGVVAQRLLPRLCRHCSVLLSKAEGRALPQRLMRALATWGELDRVRLKGPGCEHCDHDGTVDRFAVAEVLVADAKLMQDFVERGSEVARANYYARPDADPSMLMQAIRYALAGVVDPRAVEEEVDLIEPYAASMNQGSPAHCSGGHNGS